MKKFLSLLLGLIVVMACSLPGKAAASVPEWLVEAIIQMESGGNPYAVNISGESHFPAGPDEALRLIEAAQASGRSYDVGLMQVNSFWIAKYGIAPGSLLDPAVNRQWGKRILAEEIARHGLTWAAVGRYHSPDTERGRRYAWKIYALVRRALALPKQ